MPLVQPADFSIHNEAIVGPELMVSAFQKALLNRQKQADLERKLQDMATQDALRERQMQMQDKWHQVAAEGASQRINIAKSRAQLEKERNDYQKEKSGVGTDRILNFQRELNGIDSKPGTQAWQDKADLVKADYADVFPTVAGQRVWRDSFAEHKYTASTSRQSINDIIKRYTDNLKSNGLNDYAFENPQVWKDDPKNKRKALLMDAGTGIIMPPDTDTSKNVDATGKPRFMWKTLPYSDWNTFKAQHDKFKSVMYSHDERPAEQTSVEDAPANPADRVAETIYRSPSTGKLGKWTGTGWANP